MTSDAGGKLLEARWAEVYDELRSHQSLTSVVNDPNRGKGIFKGKIEGIGDLWDKVRETAEELNDQREAEVKGVSDTAAVDLGVVPELADFDAYLSTFSDLWDVYARNLKPRGAAAQSAGQQDPADNGAACEAHHSVPREYFQSEFKLEHHQIFRQSVQTSIERAEDINDELTGHLDMIEVSLFEHIRRAQRDQLFESLARLGDPLQEDLRTTLSVVRALRGQLRSVQRKQLRCGMAVGRLARRKRRVAEVLQRLDCLAHVQQSQPSIQILLQGQDYVPALELLESTKTALDTDLKGLVSIKSNSNRLASLGHTFDTSIEVAFVGASAEAILSSPSSSASAASTSAGTNGRAGETSADEEPELRGAERLRCLCWCLSRRELLKSVLSSTLRDALLAQLKKDLRTRWAVLLEEYSQADAAAREQQAVPSASPRAEDGAPAAAGAEQPAAPSGGRSASNTASVRGLGFEAFLAFWQRILQSCVDVARRFCDYAALVQGTVSPASASDVGHRGPEASAKLPEDAVDSDDVQAPVQSEPSSASRTSRGEVIVSDELLRLFEVIMNMLIQKAGVFLQARQGEHQMLKVSDWQRLLQLTTVSLDEVRSLQDVTRQRLGAKDAGSSGDLCGGLRALLYSQTKMIIEEFHQRHLAQLSAALEEERAWERIDVPQPYKVLLLQLVGRLSGDGEASPSASDPASVDRSLQVDHLNFLVVPPVLTLIQLLGDYVQLCRDLEALAAETVQRIMHLLREFNQKTQLLILKGQAVPKGYMKKITASNLALCSQCCGLFAMILPKLQTNLLEILQGQGSQASGAPARQIGAALLGDLTKIAGDFDEHRSLLFGKLSDLLTDRYEWHAKKSTTPWLNSPHQEIGADEPAWGAGAEPNFTLHPHEALEGLVKDITSMYRVLLKNLSGESVKKIFAKAFAEIAQKFEQRLGQEMPVASPPYLEQVGRSLGDRLAMDLAYLQEQLSKLSGITTPLQHLLGDLVHHLQSKLLAEEPLKKLHPAVLEALQRTRGLPA